MSDRGELLQRSRDVLGWIARKEIELRIDKVFRLADAPNAHKYLESRMSTGKVLLQV